MKLRDISLKNVHCASPSMDLAEVASMMKRHNVGIIPVCEGKRLVGVLTDRDLVISCMASDLNPRACKARDYMTANPIIATPDMDIEEAAELMGREQIHRLPVVENGELVGMVSLGDISLVLMDKHELVAQTLRRIKTPIHAIQR
jgi:CBS domain-containing protein